MRRPALPLGPATGVTATGVTAPGVTAVRVVAVRVAAALGTAALLTVGLAGCSGGSGPVFNDEGGAAVTCLVHQADEPGTRYLDPAERNTDEVLAMMKYYTQFGAMPFCDGATAGDADRAWAQLYIDLGGTSDKVPTLLG